jgi:hypothetical protein
MILPGTGRWQREALTEGVLLLTQRLRRTPSTTRCAAGPPPRSGEEFE